MGKLKFINFLKTKNTLLADLPIIFFLALVCHFLFSKYGFTNGDEGFNFAISKRLLAGQIPHLDFFSFRPPLTPLIWSPFLIFFPENFYMMSRLFVWLEWGIIAWIAHKIFISHLPINDFQKKLLAICSFCLTSNMFLLMPWYTTDGVLMASIGLLLLYETSKESLAFIIFGLSILCKQNFIFLILIFLFKRYRNKQNIFYFILPGTIYFLYLCVTGSLANALTDFTTFTNFIQVGVLTFVTHKSFYRGIILFSIIDLVKILDKKNKFKFHQFISPITLSIIYGALLAAKGHPHKIAIFFFGGCFYLLFKTKFRNEKKLMIYLIAWISSISIGHNAPLICLGALFCMSYSESKELHQNKYFTFAMSVLCCFFLINARLNWIHGEKNAYEITSPLDNVLPGGKGLYTFKQNAEAIEELSTLFTKNPHETKIIIPDYPGFWPGTAQLNPLPSDWASHLEIPTIEYMNRYIDKLKTLKSGSLAFVAKYEAFSFTRDALVHRHSTLYHQFIEEHFTKLNATKYFDIYRVP